MRGGCPSKLGQPPLLVRNDPYLLPAFVRWEGRISTYLVTSFRCRPPAWHFTSCNSLVHFINNTAIEPLCYCLLI